MSGVSGTDRVERVGWVGLGLMGSRMLPHLMAAGHPATIMARRDDVADAFIARGARRVGDPTAVAAESDVVFTMVAMPDDVADVWLGEHGLLAGARSGTTLVDMTTSSPALARRLAGEGAARGVEVVDAPVSGGPAGAEEATLSIMVGGTDAAVHRVRPLLERLGATIVHHGGAGTGQAAKIANQVVVAGTMLAICEAYLLARGQGLDQDRVLETMGAGIVGSGLLRFMWPRIAGGDLEPGFRVEHLIKDLALALDAAHESGAALPGTALVKELYHAVVASGLDGKGTQALVTALDRRAVGGDRGSGR